MHKLETLLEQSSELPSLPEIYKKVSELLEDDNSTSQQIGRAVQTDPSLSVRILKMINSAYFGLPNQVTSVSQSVTLLGHQQLKQILMGTVLAGVFGDLNIDNFPILDFWQHSIKTAIIARHLAMQNAQIIDHEAFFTAGLLHDIGRLVIAKVAPDSLAEINDLVKANGLDIVQLEADKLGVTHIEVGAALMNKWGLPNLLTQCVLDHHETDHVGPFAIHTSIVYLANQLSQNSLVNEEEEMQDLLTKIPNWQQTKCTMEQIHIACRLADDQWFEVMESLDMVDSETSNRYY